MKWICHDMVYVHVKDHSCMQVHLVCMWRSEMDARYTAQYFFTFIYFETVC